MIPKIIYTTWISHKPLPGKFVKYINSWKKFLPDYEIRMITFENTPRNKFIETFIENQKYAVAAQYARCQRIFETGGLYFDIDIEVVKSFDDLLEFEMFAGIESDNVEHYVNNAIFGAVKNHPFMLECMNYMDNIDRGRSDIEVSTGPLMFTALMKRKGWIPSNSDSYFSNNKWKSGIDKKQISSLQLFNSKYFYPYFYTEQFYPECVTDETFAIHHWAATWVNSVSVIILCNDDVKLISESTESFLNQSVKPIEIILANIENKNNYKTIKETALKYKVKYLQAERDGLTSVKNEAVNFAKGRWITIVKAGRVPVKDFIEKTIDKNDIVINNSSSEISGEKNKMILFRKEVWEKIKGYDETKPEEKSDADFCDRAEKEEFGFTSINDQLFSDIV